MDPSVYRIKLADIQQAAAAAVAAAAATAAAAGPSHTVAPSV